MNAMTERVIDLEAAKSLQPGTFTRDHVPEDPAAQLAGLVAVLDLQETYPPILALRDWVAERLAVGEGDTVVDVGCGTGTEVRRLAQRVGPTGRSIGVEPHPGLRGVALERRAEEESEAEFVDGLAAALPFDAECVDAIRCERVLQHLTDPQAAVAEMARVLRPGGRLVLVDSDWGTSIMSHGDADVIRRYQQVAWTMQPNAFAGRHLRRWLAGAGLTLQPDIGSAVLVFPPPGVKGFGMMEIALRKAIDEGAITEAESEDLKAEASAAIEAGTWLSSVTMFAVVGVKP
jgi:SAM-dependent methyltransferase